MGLLWNTRVHTYQDWEWGGKEMIGPCASFIIQMGDQASASRVGESANPVVFPLPTTTCEKLESNLNSPRTYFPAYSLFTSQR